MMQSINSHFRLSANHEDKKTDVTRSRKRAPRALFTAKRLHGTDVVAYFTLDRKCANYSYAKTANIIFEYLVDQKTE